MPLKNLAKELKNAALITAGQSDDYKPVLIRLHDEESAKKLEGLLKIPGIQVFDNLMEQLRELIKTNNPRRKFKAEELEEAVAAHLNGVPIETYGVWVHYPWSNRLIHIPDESEFIELRTNRNIYKITREERDLLAGKKVGIIGLSVGQSVALALAMERGCGELRLADFDTLEITNLNRIRAGLHNLGLLKVISVAREIAEIDPFFKVTCFREGIHESNLEAFMMEGGKLDLLIEESDGLDVKILSRFKARELGIPVTMEASDRCMVDVERFDLEPERPILHGLMGHLDPAMLKTLKTSEEKIPYMLDIIGFDTISTRAKASMLEIEQTISTWPQLASAVIMGGGIMADISRRILLGQYNQSGRYHIDIEELVGDPKTVPVHEDLYSKIKFTDIPAIAASYQVPDGGISLPDSHLGQLIEAARWAPSGGNYQPWCWVSKNDALLLINPMDANPVFLGYGNISTWVAAGTGIENTVLQAGLLNYKTEVRLFPEPGQPDLMACLTFKNDQTPNPTDMALAQGIFERHTNRNLDPRRVILPEYLEQLRSEANVYGGTRLTFLESENELDEAAGLLGELEKIRFLEPDGHRDFAMEIRWTEQENETLRNGIDIKTMDLTPSEIAGLRIAQGKDVADQINAWNGGGAFRKLIKKSIDASGALGILTVDGQRPEDYIRGGRALERVWIKANQLGLAFQPVSSCLYVYARLLQGQGAGLTEKGIKTLQALRPDFDKLFQTDPGRGEILIFRLAVPQKPVTKSIRRELKDMFFKM